MVRKSPHIQLRRLAFVVMGFLLGLVIAEFSLRALRRDSRARDLAVDLGPSRTLTIRGRSYSLGRDHQKTRVLFIGDSGTEGTGVLQGDAFPAKFKEQIDLRFEGNDVEVINAGVWGMTTIDEYHLLKDHLLVLQPDIVVLGLFMSNDINFNLAHRWRRDVPGRGRRVLRALRQHSALVHLVHLRAVALNDRFRILRPVRAEERSLVPRALRLIDANGFNMLSYPVGETATYMKQPSALMEQAYDLLDDVFAEFCELGEANGFEFRVLIIPSPSAVVGVLTLLHFQFDTFRFLESHGARVTPEQLDFTVPTRRVTEICARRAIACLDPTEAMQVIGIQAFFPEDEHNTPAGHNVLARELTERWKW